MLAEKENERILSRSKENKVKEKEFIEKCLSEINDLKNQRQEIILENNKVSFDALAGYEIPLGKIESKLNHSRKWKNRLLQSSKKDEWSE